MVRQMVSHRSKEYVSMHYETVDLMQEMLETKNSVYLFSSSGTGFMRARLY
jgi:aspartate aminotransferase-like enzyme